MVVKTTVTYRLEGSEVETLTARLRGLVIRRQLQERKLQERDGRLSDERSDEPVVRLRAPGSDRWSTAQLYRPVVPEDDQQNQQDAARKFLRSPIEPPSAARAQDVAAQDAAGTADGPDDAALADVYMGVDGQGADNAVLVINFHGLPYIEVVRRVVALCPLPGCLYVQKLRRAVEAYDSRTTNWTGSWTTDLTAWLNEGHYRSNHQTGVLSVGVTKFWNAAVWRWLDEERRDYQAKEQKLVAPPAAPPAAEPAAEPAAAPA
eukprot:COSAG04_NODE_121_length_24915_cov_61.932181_1_plen_261_part_10